MKSGTNSAVMRIKNEKNILSMINRAPMSRVEISRATGLTKAAVTIIADELISKGWVTENEASTPRVGRKPLLLSFRGEALFAIGINITRTKFSVGISDFNGQVIAEREFDICSDKIFFERIGGIVFSMIAECGLTSEQIKGIGIVTPGPVDLENNKILNPPNFKSWTNVPVVEELKKIFAFEILFSSVSGGVTVSEKYFGAAKQSDNFAALLINRDGIGSGVVLDGKLFRGNNEIGHTSIRFDGIPCECGNRGCLEKYASLSAVIKNSPYLNWESVMDAEDTALIEKESGYLSTAVINAANSFDIDLIVLCGDICYKAKPLVESIQRKIDGRTLCRNFVRVVSGTEFCGARIAASLVVHKFFC